MNEKKIIQVEEKVPAKLLIPLSIQHMFAMFGASVLVPFIFGINPAIVLFMNGLGTLLFIAITKGKAPAVLTGALRIFTYRPRLAPAKRSQNQGQYTVRPFHLSSQYGHGS